MQMQILGEIELQMKRCKCRHIGGANYLHLHFSTSTRSNLRQVTGNILLFALIAHAESQIRWTPQTLSALEMVEKRESGPPTGTGTAKIDWQRRWAFYIA